MPEHFTYQCPNEANITCAESCVGLYACEQCDCTTVSLEANGDGGNAIDFTYRCQDETDIICAENCFGLYACEECECATVPLEAGGDWGNVVDVILSLFPIVFLIVVTVKPKPLPTTLSLPLAAFFMWLVRLMYLGDDPLLTCGSIVLGLHEALTPLSIMAGAITLFETMEATYCLPYMMREMKALTAGHPVAELMLIFCFAYMIEGASGFGTPVALGAPMLVSSGHSKMKSVVTLLIMNTFATVWGAVGTPIWFGFGEVFESEKQDDAFLEISYKAGVCLAISAFLLLPLLLCIICPWALVKRNLLFIFLSLATVVGPSLGISFGSEEFASLIGGMVGCAGTAFLIKFKIGLSTLEGYLTNEDGKSVMDIGSVSESSLAKKIEESQSVSGSNRDGKASSSTRKNYKHASSNISDVTTDAVKQNGSWRGNESWRGKDEEDARQDSEKIEPIVEDDGQVEMADPKSNGYSKPEEDSQGKVAATDKNGGEDADDPPIVDTTDTLKHDGDVDVISQIQELDGVLGPRKEFGQGYMKELIARTSPIWLVVVILVLTRIEEIGIKEYLTKREPNFAIFFPTYGTFRLSASLVLQLDNILTYPGLNWKYELLYIPFFIPFVLVSLVTMLIFRKDLQRTPREIAGVVTNRLANPAIALLGALCLVQLLLKVDTAAPAYILGTVISDWFKEAFIIFTPLLGALGSFFSGSTTVSNLTFGTIQALAADSIGVSKTSLLALQVVGASAGNGICLNNIIAACAVVGLNIGEGAILKQTYKFVLGITTISTLVMLALFLRF